MQKAGFLTTQLNGSFHVDDQHRPRHAHYSTSPDETSAVMHDKEMEEGSNPYHTLSSFALNGKANDFEKDEMSRIMRKAVFCICENEVRISFMATVQLISAFWFCCIDSTIPLLSKSKVSSL